MPKRFFVHLGVIVVSVGGLLYMMQNCGADIENERQQLTGTTEAGDVGGIVGSPGGDAGEMRELSLTIAIENEDGQADSLGLALTGNPEVTAFKAQLHCSSTGITPINSSPVLVSANSFCAVGLKELSFASGANYKNFDGLTIEKLAKGTRHIFRTEDEKELIVVVEDQLSVVDSKANVLFRFFQVTRNRVVTNGKINGISVQGDLAPEFRLARTDIGTSNAGIVLITSYICEAAFSRQGSGVNESFSCGSNSLADLKFLFEPLPSALDLDEIERDEAGSIDGPDGLIAQLGKIGKPLKSLNPIITSKGFSLYLLLPHVNSARFAGLPEQVLFGVSTASGAVTSSVTDLAIQL